jgi:putative ABC transport system permease protein
MLKNYLKIAWRSMMKNKVFSFINIFGLAIGITVCMMIFMFIANEFSFDKFHVNGKNIYRIMRGFDDNGSKKLVPWLSPPYATALKNDYPDEIKKIVRVEPANDLVSFGDRSFNEKKILFADTGFFTFFSFPLLKGDPSTALRDPGSVVLTETTARKFFGDDDPMGKVIQMDQSISLKVTGVAKDVPSNSHLNFDLVVPLSNHFSFPGFDTWATNRLFTYVLLNDHIAKAQLEKSLPQFMDKYMGPDMIRQGRHYDLSLLPLYDIYFSPSASDGLIKHDDKSVVYIFLSVAILILLIACINFMNLSTIRAVDRSKEVGLRKVLGAQRSNLVRQFIGESILLTAISCVFSIALLSLVMPWYNRLLGNKLAFSGLVLPVYLSLIIVVGVLAGTYPAFILSAFSPIQALKGKLRLGKGGSFFRQALVVLQFSISVLLIICTIIIMSQMNYLKNKDLGYNEEQTVIVPLDNLDIIKGENNLKTDLEAKSNVISVSLMSGEPGGYFDGMTFNVEGHQGDQPWKSRTEFTDFQFVKTLGLKIVAGRDFSAQYSTDSTNATLINQTAAAELGFTPDQAVGKWIQNTSTDSLKRMIIGVVQDFNFLSLKEKIYSLVIAPGYDKRVALIRLRPGNMQSAISAISDAYKDIAPAYPFEYSFLDQKFDTLYKADIRQQTLLSLFSALAIFIACMGLFGLASFTAARRLKEIGVRKVLGASVRNIVLLLSKDLLKPVLLATIIAIPAGYYIMSHWLRNFAYRTALHWWIFVGAAAITLSIALFTISFKAVKAALLNPAKSLRVE